jgi:hypothetical protein
MFSLILVGVGVAMLAIGVLQFATNPPTSQLSADASAALTSKSDAPAKSKGGGFVATPGVRVGVAGFVLACLGAALCFKVRQITRTGGVEPSECGTAAT